jgi:hypothetical protein
MFESPLLPQQSSYYNAYNAPQLDMGNQSTAPPPHRRNLFVCGGLIILILVAAFFALVWVTSSKYQNLPVRMPISSAVSIAELDDIRPNMDRLVIKQTNRRYECGVIGLQIGDPRRYAVFASKRGMIQIFNPGYKVMPNVKKLDFSVSSDFCNTTVWKAQSRYSQITAFYDDFLGVGTKVMIAMEGDEATCWQRMIDLFDGQDPCIPDEKPKPDIKQEL